MAQMNGGRQPSRNNDSGWLVAIILAFIFFWPAGIILLLVKNSQSKQRKQTDNGWRERVEQAERQQEERRRQQFAQGQYQPPKAQDVEWQEVSPNGAQAQQNAFTPDEFARRQKNNTYAQRTSGNSYSYRYENGRPISTAQHQYRTSDRTGGAGYSAQQQYAQPQRPGAQPSGQYAQPQQPGAQPSGQYAQPQRPGVQPSGQYAQPQQPEAKKTYSRESEPPKKKRKVKTWFYNLIAAITGFIGIITLAETIGDWMFFGFFAYELSDLIVSLIFLAAGLVSFWLGMKKRKQNRRFSRIETIIGSRKHISVEAIAKIMSVSIDTAAKNIEDMLDRGYFGEKAYLDYSKMELVLDADAINNLSDAFAPKPEQEETPADQQDSERSKTIAEIRRLNDAIADEEVSEKIYRIEELTNKILSAVELKPEKQPQIRSFMNYYLPTTLKLLSTYSDFEAQGADGEMVAKTKKSIEEILDNLIAAFEQQFEQLFSSEAMDISSDIEVLENMMRRDGFSDDQMTLGV